MLGYIALLGLSLCGGSSISISLLCLCLSGRHGEPTAEGRRGFDMSYKHLSYISAKVQQVAFSYIFHNIFFCSKCLPLMVDGAEFII